MDAYEATRIVFSRIQTLDPENAAKIMGLLLIQDHSEKEMIRLAFGPEALLHSLILKARKDLNLLPPSPSSASSNPFQRQNRAPPPPLSINSPSWAPPQPDLFSPEDEFLNEQMYDGSSTHHRRSYSDFDAAGFGWKPCLYYARGFCKNGSACRFLHGMPEDGSGMSNIEQELMLMRSKSQRLGSAASMCFPYSPTGSLGPMSPSSSSFLFQQEKQRAATAAAAAAMMLGGDDGYKFMSPRTDPGARQIYLTFPADSTFREEDVSNYFSIYGPVQDVRIPYQQKRMFGFVTFLYPETVKLILAKGNPHFVCDARVLVKPYKEKGKIAEKKLQAERGDFSCGNTPTGFDTRDPFDFQQLGPRLMYGNSNQEMMLRRKLEEQMQAAELQQAIEMQGRRFMGLQLLDFKNRSMSTSTTISSRTNDISHDGSPTEEKSPSPVMLCAVNAAAVGADKDETAETGREVTTKSNEDSDFQESTEHNLPDSPFASPTKASPFVNGPFSVQSASVLDSEFLNGNGSHIIDSSPSSALDMASFKSCFFQMPRFSSGHGAVGL